MVYFGLPFFMLMLHGCTVLYLGTKDLTDAWQRCPNTPSTARVFFRDLFLLLSVLIKLASLWGVLVLAFMTITSDQALEGKEGTYPPVVSILTNLVALGEVVSAMKIVKLCDQRSFENRSANGSVRLILITKTTHPHRLSLNVGRDASRPFPSRAWVDLGVQ